VAVFRGVADCRRRCLLVGLVYGEEGPPLQAEESPVPSGKPIRRGNLNQLLTWRKTVERLGLDGVHFHDLRHTGNTRQVRSCWV
jgi:hypothetical protein